MKREKPACRSDPLGEWLTSLEVGTFRNEARILLAGFCDQATRQRRTVAGLEDILHALDGTVESAQEPRCATPVLFRAHLAVQRIGDKRR